MSQTYSRYILVKKVKQTFVAVKSETNGIKYSNIIRLFFIVVYCFD